MVYDSIAIKYENDTFTRGKGAERLEEAFKGGMKLNFVTELDRSTEVVVYARLPRSFFIPTPVGNYSPDWAIAFESGKPKHVYFMAETKGSMSSMQLRKIEECRIECARKFFAKVTSDQVKFDIVENYDRLINLVK